MNWYTRGSDSPHSGGRGNWTDTAQICLNGHLINAYSEYSNYKNKKFCPECGESTVTNCPECNGKIPGKTHYVNVIGNFPYTVPAYCSECGKPYPWTERKLKAAKELLEEQEAWKHLEEEQAKQIEASLKEITHDTPQAAVGATRLKKFMVKLGSGAGDVLKEMITDIASETAKKVLFGQ